MNNTTTRVKQREEATHQREGVDDLGGRHAREQGAPYPGGALLLPWWDKTGYGLASQLHLKRGLRVSQFESIALIEAQ